MKKASILVATLAIILACNNKADKKETTDTTTNTIDHTATDPANDTQGSTEVNDTDREFALKAGMGNTAEIEAGTLAADKGDNKEIRDFGAMMVKDHQDAQSQLKAIAGSLSLNAPDSVDQEHNAMKAKLSGLKRKAFDTEYIAAQVKDHRMTITLFEKQINGGSNARLKQFATSTLPHIKMHLEKAEALQEGNK